MAELNALRKQQALSDRFALRAHCHLTAETAWPQWFWRRLSTHFSLPPGRAVQVHIGDAPLSRADAAAIAALGEVREIRLMRGVEEPGVFDELSRLPRLEQLALFDAERRHLDDGKLVRVAEIRTLKALTIHSTGVTDQTFDKLSQMPVMESLDIQYARITFAGLRPWIAANRLKQLRLCISLSDENCRELAEFASLRVLATSGLNPTGEALLKGLPNLLRLELSAGG